MVHMKKETNKQRGHTNACTQTHMGTQGKQLRPLYNSKPCIATKKKEKKERLALNPVDIVNKIISI